MRKAYQNEKNDCGNKNIVLKTERIEKNRKFLFWKLRLKKIITIDEILDSEKNIIFKRKSISICSTDACDERKFCRIKIVNNEIWIFQSNKNYDNAIIKRYDYCGKYLGKKAWKEEAFSEY